MRDGVTAMKKILLDKLLDLIWIVLALISAFAVLYFPPSEWLAIAYLTFLLLLTPVSEWLKGREKKHPQTMRKALAHMAIALVGLMLASLLFGWAVGMAPAPYGNWVLKALGLSGFVLVAISLIRRARQKRSVVTGGQEK